MHLSFKFFINIDTYSLTKIHLKMTCILELDWKLFIRIKHSIIVFGNTSKTNCKYEHRIINFSTIFIRSNYCLKGLWYYLFHRRPLLPEIENGHQLERNVKTFWPFTIQRIMRVCNLPPFMTQYSKTGCPWVKET